jgi:hypothetical protein
MMHRRMTVVAEGQIVEAQRCRCSAHRDTAQCTAAHKARTTTATATSRSQTDILRIEGDTDAGW